MWPQYICYRISANSRTLHVREEFAKETYLLLQNYYEKRCNKFVRNKERSDNNQYWQQVK
jgi:hypothetical protein